MPTALNEDERTALATEHPDWAIDGEEIRREFVLTDFAEAIGFVTRVAITAEAVDHHPDIDIRWNRVTLTLSTHSIGALSDLDAALVATIDRF
jgi:4a-hydroxytetrahydrobiopterin dehydratase